MTTDEEIPSTSAVAGAALEILKTQHGTDRGIYLSRLGGMLSAHFRRPIREILGTQKLSQILTDGLGAAIKLEGTGSAVVAKLASDSEMTGGAVRFDPALWAAFTKPIPPGTIRYLKVTRPFTFVSDPTKVTWDDPREIHEDDIADTLLEKAERDREITQKIDNWCSRNGVSPARFIYEAVQPAGRPQRGVDRKGDVLRRMIEAVPVEKRGEYTLPLDLIYELLDK